MGRPSSSNWCRWCFYLEELFHWMVLVPIGAANFDGDGWPKRASWTTECVLWVMGSNGWWQ